MGENTFVLFFTTHLPQQPPVVGRGWLSTGKDKVARTPQIPFVLLLLLFEKQEWRGRFHVIERALLCLHRNLRLASIAVTCTEEIARECI